MIKVSSIEFKNPSMYYLHDTQQNIYIKMYMKTDGK